MNTKEFFNNQLPTALAANSEDAKTINARYQINIAGTGEWNLDLTANGPVCKAGTGPADCTVSLDEASFQKLASDPKSALMMFFTGKMKVSGNQMLGSKLSKVLDYVKK